MKSFLYLGTFAVLATAQAYAQDGTLAARQLQKTSGTEAQVVEGSPGATTTQQPVYIVNQPYAGAAAGARVQSQPTTIVEASPVAESRAEALRKARQEVELNTERRIVEKLEASRIEDEKNRANRIFGQPAEQAPVYGQPAAPVNFAGAQAGAVAGNGQAAATATAVVAGPQQTVVADKPATEKSKDDNKSYVGLLVGVPAYPGVRNVKANISSGFSVGMMFPERLSVEGFFIYSNFDIEQVDIYGQTNPIFPWIRSLDQYNVGGALKYNLFDARITPVVGGVASYTYRAYQDHQFWGGAQSNQTSQAFDAGGLIGAEAKLTERLFLGGDFRYLMNLTNRTDNRLQQSFVYNPYLGQRPIEDLSYYIMSVNARFSF